MANLLSWNTQRIDELNHVCRLIKPALSIPGVQAFHGVSNVIIIFQLSSCTLMHAYPFLQKKSFRRPFSVHLHSVPSIANRPPGKGLRTRRVCRNTCSAFGGKCIASSRWSACRLGHPLGEAGSLRELVCQVRRFILVAPTASVMVPLKL